MSVCAWQTFCRAEKGELVIDDAELDETLEGTNTEDRKLFTERSTPLIPSMITFLTGLS